MARKVMQKNYDYEGKLISKECSCCHKIKPVSEFNKANKSIDGLQSKCRKCSKQCFKEYYKNNKEYCIEYSKDYNTKKTQEALQQIKIEVESNPEKYNHIEGKDIYGIIYLVHNIKSDKYYIGQTTAVFDIRYKSGWLHEHGRKNEVKEDLELYGENSFEYIKLFKVAHSQYELDKLEAYYIDYYNSYENGYNENRGNIFTDRGKEK